ncbi:MFS transporter, partial [Rhizobium sp. SIMBA_035]
MVLVNTVVLVRGSLGLSESALAWTMFAFGTGSMAAALTLPRALDVLPDRPVMFAGAALMVVTLFGLGMTTFATDLGWPTL